MAARSAPDTGVRPPARRFTTVPSVAPAPGRPPINPAATLPMPCPTSSRFGLWRVRVIESATSDVSRLSMEPSSAMMMAGCTARTSTSGASSGNRGFGRPVGTSPMTGVSVNHSTPSSVPASSAASGPAILALTPGPDIEMHPGFRIDELLQEDRGCNRPGHPARGAVDQIRNWTL